MKRAQADQTYAQFKRALSDIYGNDKDIKKDMIYLVDYCIIYGL